MISFWMSRALDAGLRGTGDVTCGRGRVRMTSEHKTIYLQTRAHTTAIDSTHSHSAYLPTFYSQSFHDTHISIMVRALTKVVYKPDSQSTDEFTVIVNPAEVRASTVGFCGGYTLTAAHTLPVQFKKWKEGGSCDLMRLTRNPR